MADLVSSNGLRRRKACSGQVKTEIPVPLHRYNIPLMATLRELDGLVGQRLRMRDLRVFLAVVQTGSMARAAAQLGVSQPAVSMVIASLEHALKVPLFDRGPKGVELNRYGSALLHRTHIAFDEFHQALRDIDGLANPGAGHVRIGCPESITGGTLTPIVARFNQEHPGAVVVMEQITTPTLDLPSLRERRLDFVLARMPSGQATLGEGLNVEHLFDDQLVVAAGRHTKWAARRRIDLAELEDEPWILTPEKAWNTVVIAEVFSARGLAMPKVAVVTYSVLLRTTLLAAGPYITTFPLSVLSSGAYESTISILPVQLPPRPWPVVAVTIKGRTLSPVVHRFLDHLRTPTSAKRSASSGPLRTRKAA